MKTLMRLTLLLILSLAAVPAQAQAELPQTLSYTGDIFQFDYPAELELIDSLDLIRLDLDIEAIRIHILSAPGFETFQARGYKLSPDQSPLEMMRGLVDLLKRESPEYEASLESVSEISLGDGRAGLLLDAQVEDDTRIYALSFPLADGRTWLMAAEYQSSIAGAASQALLLAIADTLQPLGSDESAIAENLPQSYVDDSIQFRIPAGMRLDEEEQGLTLRSQEIQFEYVIVNPAAFAALQEEGLELDPSMTPQQMMIGFVRAIRDLGEDSISLEAVRESSLADGRPIMILRHHFPEDLGTIILVALPLNDESATLAGVFISEAPSVLSDLLNPEAERVLLGILESLRLVSS